MNSDNIDTMMNTLTPSEVEAARTLLHEGYSHDYIATQLATTPAILHSLLLDESSILADYQDLSIPVTSILHKYGIQPARLYHILQRNSTPIRRHLASSDTELASGRKAWLDDACGRYIDGEKISTIIAQTGITQPALHLELSRRGIPLRRRSTRPPPVTSDTPLTAYPGIITATIRLNNDIPVSPALVELYLTSDDSRITTQHKTNFQHALDTFNLRHPTGGVLPNGD